VKVADVELVGGTTLGRGRDRGKQMEHGRDGRHESGRKLASA